MRISSEKRAAILADTGSTRDVGRRHGVSHVTVARVRETVPEKTRTADEFKGTASAVVRPPVRAVSAYSWSLETIRNARNAQLRGDFQLPVRMAEAMRTDDALFTPYINRIAPLSVLESRLVPHKSTRGRAVAKKAGASVLVSRSVLRGIAGTMANHGIAIGYLEHEPNDDGTRVDMRLTEWPLEHVKWNASREILETRIKNGLTTPIVHGDGRWIVFRRFHALPWTQDACILPGALCWAAHANAIKDWAAGSAGHGQDKIMGELPAGIALLGPDGALTPEAAAFLAMLQDIVAGEAGAGIRPAGSLTDFLSNKSTAWEIFKELANGREKAAARIYLGTDAILGSVGGAPGVDIAALFGVATTMIQGDLTAIEEALDSGLWRPWTAINEGDSHYAPTLHYQIPDPDADAKSKETEAKYARLFDVLAKMRNEQMIVDQDVVNRVAGELGVAHPPKLASAEKRTASLQINPENNAAVVRVDELRGSQGLPAVGGTIGVMYIPEFNAHIASKKAAADAEAQAIADAKVKAAPTA